MGVHVLRARCKKNELIVYSDALEQVDISLQLIRRHSDVRYSLRTYFNGLIDVLSQTFQLALNSRDIIDAMRRGKVAALLGLEGFALSALWISLSHRHIGDITSETLSVHCASSPPLACATLR